VDTANRTVTVSGNDGDKQFNLDPSAQIALGSQTDAKVDDLKTGSKISVEYQEKNGKSVAKSVQAQESSSDKSSSDKSSSDKSSSSSSSDSSSSDKK